MSETKETRVIRLDRGEFGRMMRELSEHYSRSEPAEPITGENADIYWNNLCHLETWRVWTAIRLCIRNLRWRPRVSDIIGNLPPSKKSEQRETPPEEIRKRTRKCKRRECNDRRLEEIEPGWFECPECGGKYATSYYSPEIGKDKMTPAERERTRLVVEQMNRMIASNDPELLEILELPTEEMMQELERRARECAAGPTNPE